MRKGQQCSPYRNEFQLNGTNISNKKDIANGFNDFFVNVGPNLAHANKKPNNDKQVLDYLNTINPESMFLAGFDESEIINVVNNFKNKKSTGYDNIDMCIIKQIVQHAIKGTRHKQNSLSGNTLFNYMPT